MHEPYWIDAGSGFDWELASQIATTFGLMIAGVSALLALLNYRSQIENQADQHMHGLFNGLLTARLETNANAKALWTLELYVLEEMLDWVRDQERDLRWWGWLRPFSYWRRREALEAWESTIRGNLSTPQAAWDRVKDSTSYGKQFRRFVAKSCKPPVEDAEIERRLRFGAVEPPAESSTDG